MFQVTCVNYDAGHGGPDSGSFYGGYKESDLNIKISHRAKALTEFYLPARMTRKYTDSKEVPLFDRVNVAARPDDIFISVHCNASHISAAKGLEVYCMPGSEKGQRLAKLCLDNIMSAARSAGYGYFSRGIKDGSGLYVIRNTVCPAVLIECGFMSNPEELSWLVSAEGHTCIGYSIALSVLQFAGVK